jgi:hypothetical protein
MKILISKQRTSEANVFRQNISKTKTFAVVIHSSFTILLLEFTIKVRFLLIYQAKLSRVYFVVVIIITANKK